MSARDFLSNIAIILFVMAIGALIESVVPMSLAVPGNSGRRTANLWLTATVFLINWLLSSLAAVAALTLRPAGLMSQLQWPVWLQIVTGIVVLDFSVGYLSHRTMHMWPAMWRFHQVHHSDDFVDVTTTYRTHPVETIWRFLFTIVPVWVFGLPAQAVVIQRILQATNGVLGHANIRVWPPLDRIVSLVWVTPNVHKIHHSRQISETNSNYANLLTLYDRLLGTYTPAERAQSVVYGLDDAEPLATGMYPTLLALPFHAAQQTSDTEGKVGIEAPADR